MDEQPDFNRFDALGKYLKISLFRLEGAVLVPNPLNNPPRLKKLVLGMTLHFPQVLEVVMG